MCDTLNGCAASLSRVVWPLLCAGEGTVPVSLEVVIGGQQAVPHSIDVVFAPPVVSSLAALDVVGDTDGACMLPSQCMLVCVSFFPR